MNDIIGRILGTTQLGQFWRIALIVSIFHTHYNGGDASLGFIITIVLMVLDALVQDIKHQKSGD